VTGALLASLEDGLALALLIAAPILVAALLGGMLSGLLGNLTQIDDPAVGLVIRVAAVALAVAIFTPAIAGELTTLATHLGAVIARIDAG
jgi:flagellar biosynthesis protein FliQ